MIIPSNEVQQITIYSCSMFERKVCTQMGVCFSEGIVSSDVSEKSLTTSECWSIVQNKAWSNVSLIQIGKKSWSANSSLQAEYKYCCVDYCVLAVTLVIEESPTITENGKIGRAAGLLDVPSLSHAAGYAIHGGTVWRETSILRDFYPYAVKGVYNATISSDRHVIVETLQAAFTFKKADQLGKPICLPKDSFRPDQTGIFIRFVNQAKPWEWHVRITRC